MNRNIFFFLIVSLFCSYVCFAQKADKPPIDESFFSWELPSDIFGTSFDNQYCYYYLESAKDTRGILRSIDGRWTMSIQKPRNLAFLHNSKWAVASGSPDTLQMIRLGKGPVGIISDILDYDVFGDYLLYKLKSSPGTLRIKYFDSSVTSPDHFKEQQIENVIQLHVQRDLKQILVVQQDQNGDQTLHRLIPGSPNWYTIWKGKNLKDLTYSKPSKSWLFYGGDRSKTLFRWSGKQKDAALQISGFPIDVAFVSESVNGEWMIGNRSPIQSATAEQQQNLKLRIRNFHDPVNPFNAAALLENTQPEIFAFNTKTKKIIKITSSSERLNSQAGNYAIITQVLADVPEYEVDWNRFGQSQIFLLNLESGIRKKIKGIPKLSPYGKFLIENISLTDSILLTNIETNRTFRIPYSYVWLDQDKGVLAQDGFDYWMVDLVSGKSNCITNGFGRKNSIVFSLLNNETLDKDSITLGAWDKVTNANGFYRTYLKNRKKDPKLLHMADCKYIGGYSGTTSNNMLSFIKSRSDAPRSYVLTKDFAKFVEITHQGPEPQAAYNWLDSELHSYPYAKNQQLQGILYKPENFDATKKYPLVFTYYQRLFDYGRNFINEAWKLGDLNVAWMVSHGYLVFVPDIINEVNRGTESALSCLMAARDHLKKLPYVDSNKMGIAGHSFGGYQTNVFLTKTNLFAAAYSNAGVSNVISFFGHHPNHVKTGQLSITQTLWENPQIYLDNSAVWNANRVQTPVLLMGNEGDDLLEKQPLEFFNALRRLGKPSWLLQYDGEGHSVFGYNNQIDLSIRVQQFFDHYLKNKPAPKWMVVPGSLDKDIDSRNIAITESILIPSEQKKSDSLTNRQPIQVKF